MSSLKYLVSFVVGLRYVTAQSQNVNFNQVISINGDMAINSLLFPDGTKIEAFSQSQKQIIVNQNPSPLTANHVIGSTGQPFVQLSQNSISINTNNAQDLVGGQIELPIQQNILDQNGVTSDNTFVAKLAPDRQAWMVMEGIKMVNTTDTTVRMIKLNALDGEYMAIARKSVETGNVVTPFGLSQTQSVNISGSGIQEAEFTDGFRMSIRAVQPMNVNVDVKNGLSSTMLNNMQSLNNYRYLVRTNLASVQPNLNQMMAVVQLPINPGRVMAMAKSMGAGANDAVTLGIAQRPVLQNPGGASGNLSPQRRQDTASSSSSSSASATSASATSSSSSSASASASATDNTNTNSQDQTQQQGSSTNNNGPAATNLLLAPSFTPVAGKAIVDQVNARLAVTVSQLDGEFIITMGMSANSAQVNTGSLGQQAPSAGTTAGTTSTTGSTSGTTGSTTGNTGTTGTTGSTSSTTGTNSTRGANEPAGAAEPATKPAKRQAAAPGTITMTMAELQKMVDMVNNGRYLPIGSMMTEYAAQFGAALPATAAAAAPANPLIPPPVKREFGTPMMRRRALPLVV